MLLKILLKKPKNLILSRDFAWHTGHLPEKFLFTKKCLLFPVSKPWCMCAIGSCLFPLGHRVGWCPGLFSGHPPTKDTLSYQQFSQGPAAWQGLTQLRNMTGTSGSIWLQAEKWHYTSSSINFMTPLRESSLVCEGLVVNLEPSGWLQLPTYFIKPTAKLSNSSRRVNNHNWMV